MKQSDSLTTPDLFGKTIRTVVKNGEWMFVMKDVCEALEISDYHHAKRRLHDDEGGGVVVHSLGGPQETFCVNESGLYNLIFMSRKPVAEAFRRWVTHEVLPAIRKTGFYAAPGGASDGDALAHVQLRVRDYFALRGITGSTAGFGHTCTAICRRSGVDFERKRWKGHRFPVEVLDRAAGSRPAERGPLLPEAAPGAFVFIAKGVE